MADQHVWRTAFLGTAEIETSSLKREHRNCLIDKGRVKNFDLVKYLSDCEVPDSLQPWAVGSDGYIGKDADVGALAAGQGADYWHILPPRDGSIGGRDWIDVLRVHVSPRTELFLPDRACPPPGLRLEQLGPSRVTMLQFADDRRISPAGVPFSWEVVEEEVRP